jgi:ferredoxin
MNESKRRHLQRIAAQIGFPESETLMGLWDVMVSDREAAWIAGLPATARELAERLGADPDAVAGGLADLYQRGLVLRYAQPDGALRYEAETNGGVLMDLVLFDRRYLAWHGELFLDAWRRFYNEELVHTYEHPDPDARPFRVLPVGEQVQDRRAALPYEQVAELIRGARRISVEHCPCRTRERACDNPLETCLAFDHVADYMIARGMGRELSADEALALLARCEELGLVHVTENVDRPLVLCNCCPCCCVFLRAMTVYAKQDVIDASRYRAVVDRALCSACGRCAERCHFGAMSLAGGAAQVDAGCCLGCGLCATTCPAGAITLVEVRPQGFIPRQGSGFGALLDG